MTEFSTIPQNQIRCDYFPQCSGCEIHDHVTHPPIYNDVIIFFKSIDPSLSVPLFHQDIIGWRVRSKLAVRGSDLNPAIGLFKKGTHQVVSIPHCPLHHPSINQAYDCVQKKIISLKLQPYREQQRTGMLRYLQFVTERKSGKVQLTLVVNTSQKSHEIDSFVKQLYNTRLFSGIWLNYQPDSTNRIFSDHWELGWGDPYLWESILGISFAFHPACFAQAHLQLFESMLRSIQQSIFPDCRVIEFYAGIGVIGLSVAALSSHVICSEINPYTEECFHLSSSKLDLDIQKRVSFSLGSAEKLKDLIDSSEVLIVDPPRKGIDPSLMEKILLTPYLKQIIYVSCGFESFKKDCMKLLEKGWKVQKAETYLFFPGTNHLETLAIFHRP